MILDVRECNGETAMQRISFLNRISLEAVSGSCPCRLHAEIWFIAHLKRADLNRIYIAEENTMKLRNPKKATIKAVK